MKIDRYKKDIEVLAAKGELLHLSLLAETRPDLAKKLKDSLPKDLPRVRDEYQEWYSEALPVIRQLLPDRVDDFVGYYKPLKARKEINASTYTISDLLQGITVTRGTAHVVGFEAAVMPLEQQSLIVKSLSKRFESSLFDIRTLVQADFFDTELGAAEELNQKGFSRAAGIVAGVVLEGHLASVVQQHSLSVKKNPATSDLNDALKNAGTIDTALWRFIQHLGDLRNLCAHKKDREPTKENASELIEGVRKVVKTLF